MHASEQLLHLQLDKLSLSPAFYLFMPKFHQGDFSLQLQGMRLLLLTAAANKQIRSSYEVQVQLVARSNCQTKIQTSDFGLSKFTFFFYFSSLNIPLFAFSNSFFELLTFLRDLFI